MTIRELRKLKLSINIKFPDNIIITIISNKDTSYICKPEVFINNIKITENDLNIRMDRIYSYRYRKIYKEEILSKIKYELLYLLYKDTSYTNNYIKTLDTCNHYILEDFFSILILDQNESSSKVV
jgi:hypothetical protein